MTYAPTPYPQQQPPQPPQLPTAPPTPWYKKLWVIAVAALVIGLGIGGAAAGSSKKATAAATTSTVTDTTTATTTSVSVSTAPARTKTLRPTVVETVATRTRTQTITYTPPPKPGFDDGIYQVGRDINAGTFRTTGGDCYYAILNSPNTDDIVDNNNINGPSIVQLQSGQYFETSGGCEWRHD